MFKHLLILYAMKLYDRFNSFKLKNGYECKICLSNSSCYRDPILKDIVAGVIYLPQCGLYNRSHYDQSIKYLDLKSATSFHANLCNSISSFISDFINSI